MKLFNKKGLTLTELIVASILVGIVLIGVASFSFAVRQIQDSSNRIAILTTRVAAAMSRMSRDAKMAVGDGVSEGICEFTDDEPRKERGINFRHDVNGTPDNYDDDDWVAYIQSGSHDIQRCTGWPGVNPCADIANYTACENFLELPSTLQWADVDFFDIIRNADSQIEYVQLEIEPFFNKDLDFHPMSNPKYRLSTSINPIGHSR